MFDAEFRSPAAIAELLLPQMQRREVAAGTALHGPDNPSGSLLYIESGAVRFTSVSENGEEYEIFHLGAGEYFGEIALFAGMSPPHYAAASQETVLLSLDRGALMTLMDTHIAIRDWMLARLSRRLLFTYMMLDRARGSTGAVERVNEYCQWLRDNGYARQNDAGEWMLELTQASLAGRLGLSRSSVAEALRILREDGRIRSTYRGIILVDQES